MRNLWVLLALGAIVLAPVGLQAADEKTDTKNFFNGKDLDGWEGITEYWSVKNGALVGAHKGELKNNTFLCSKKKYGDFELSFKVQLKDGKGNSGVQIRSKVDDQAKFIVAGPQCDIGAGYWGSLYGERFGGMMKQSPADKVKKVVKDKEFNDYYILVKGKKVTIKVNGETMVDEEFEKMPAEGVIAFQVHTGGEMEVTYKDFVFKDLSKK